MLQKTDLLMLLTELQDNGEDVKQQLRKVATSSEIPLDVVKYINSKKQLDVVAFYERLRSNYNNKRSDLYKNIVAEEYTSSSVITTLSAFALQVSLYAKHVENQDMFYKHSRVMEVTNTLTNYYNTYDISSAIKLLKLIKCDILAIEYTNNRRDDNGLVIKKKRQN